MTFRHIALAGVPVFGMVMGSWSQETPGESRQSPKYCVVDTGQTHIFSDRGQLLKLPKPGEPFFGQDAFYRRAKPSYRDNGDGTVTDLNTGLTWVGARLEGHVERRRGGRSRLPSRRTRRLADADDQGSLLPDQLRGRLPPGGRLQAVPRHEVLPFRLRRRVARRAHRLPGLERTEYVSTTMNGNPTVFGVNFADGRIKGYPKQRRGAGGADAHRLYVRYVRGNPDYGKNDFHDNGDGTVSDRATGLMWSKADSRSGMKWKAALAWVQARNAEHYLGHDDWRLPNAKELQSIVDYRRAPAVTHFPAIDMVFETTRLPDGEYPYFWSSTTHLDGPADRQGTGCRLHRLWSGAWAGCSSRRAGRASPGRRPWCRGTAQRSARGDPAALPPWPWPAGRCHSHRQLRSAGSGHRPSNGAARSTRCQAAAIAGGGWLGPPGGQEFGLPLGFPPPGFPPPPPP